MTFLERIDVPRGPRGLWRLTTVAMLVSRERMEAIVETMELLANPEAMRAVAAHRAGRTKLVPLSALDD